LLSKIERLPEEKMQGIIIIIVIIIIIITIILDIVDIVRDAIPIDGRNANDDQVEIEVLLLLSSLLSSLLLSLLLSLVG